MSAQSLVVSHRGVHHCCDQLLVSPILLRTYYGVPVVTEDNEHYCANDQEDLHRDSAFRPPTSARRPMSSTPGLFGPKDRRPGGPLFTPYLFSSRWRLPPSKVPRHDTLQMPRLLPPLIPLSTLPRLSEVFLILQGDIPEKAGRSSRFTHFLALGGMSLK
jgi:hypothetical protein